MRKKILPLDNFNKNILVPPDKSITHRAVMFNSVSSGVARIYNPLLGEDCLSTIDCMTRLGAKIELEKAFIKVVGAPLGSAELNVGNSGTTIRMLSGLLCGIKGESFSLDGDKSIRKRPMNRVILPLEQMGAKIDSVEGHLAPLKINGSHLKGITYDNILSSAQVKSAILLAGLNADGETCVTEKVVSRDHTERMLEFLGADIKTSFDGEKNITCVKASELKSRDIMVTGDISSAAYPMVLALAKKGGNAVIRNVGTNPTRTGILDVFDMVSAKYELKNNPSELEPTADIHIENSKMKPFTISGALIPRLVDELPILAVLACFIEGTSIIRDASELKVKESNRIDSIVSNLKRMGASIAATDDGMIINGTGSLKGGAVIETHLDHRIAMSMAIAGALSENGCILDNAECVAVSYPGFFSSILGI